MYHKCSVEFIYKPKGILETDESFHAALSKFFTQEGYSMCPVSTKGDDAMFTIEPLPQTIEKRIKTIPVKTRPSGF